MSSLIEVLSKEDRLNVKYTDFYNIIKAGAERDIIINAVNCNVPHRYIREMLTRRKRSRESPAYI